MRYEFEKEGRPVGTAQWEGPGQVTFELSDERARPKFDRFFAREEVYLGSGHDGEEIQVRRRDWTPWGVEGGCPEVAGREGVGGRGAPHNAVRDRSRREGPGRGPS